MREVWGGEGVRCEDSVCQKECAGKVRGVGGVCQREECGDSEVCEGRV